MVVVENEMVRYITNSMDMNLHKLGEIVKVRVAGPAAVYGVPKT